MMANGLIQGATNQVTAAPAATTTTNTSAATAPAPVDYTKDLNDLYQNLLGRSVDKAGGDFYKAQLASGAADIGAVRDSIYNSEEYKNRQKTAFPVSATSRGYKATPWDPIARETVEGRISGLLDPNNPLNQQAQARAQQAAQARGLINSSLAATAGQQAVYNTALPIASQDASTFANAAQFTAGAENRASEFEAAAANAASLANAQLATGVSQSNAQNQIQLGIAGLNAETQRFVAGLNKQSQEAIANLDAKTKTDLQNIVSKNSQILQSNTSAGNLVAQYLSSVSAIQSSKDLTEAAKTAAINNQVAALQEGLRTIGGISGLDLSQYFVQLTKDSALAAGVAAGDQKEAQNSGNKNNPGVGLPNESVSI